MAACRVCCSRYGQDLVFVLCMLWCGVSERGGSDGSFFLGPGLVQVACGNTASGGAGMICFARRCFKLRERKSERHGYSMFINTTEDKS